MPILYTNIMYLELPPVVSLQGNPCTFYIKTILENATDINIHLRIQEYNGSAWIDTKFEESIPMINDVAVFDISGYFQDWFKPAFAFPEHSSNLVIPRPGMVKAFQIYAWESYLDEDGVRQDLKDSGSPAGQTFYMLPGGISDDDWAVLNENNSNWWTEHQAAGRALNWMPGIKKISPDSIEKIFWIQGTTDNIDLQFNYVDTSGLAGVFNYPISLTAYLPYEFSVSPILLKELTGKEIVSYTVSIVGTKFYQSYFVDRSAYEWSEHFLVSNSLKCYECLWCHGARTGKMEYDRQMYEKVNRKAMLLFDRSTGNIRSTCTRIHESNTGYIEDQDWIEWVTDLLNSDDVYKVEDQNSILPIIINSESVEFEDQLEAEPVSLTFEWQYSRQGKYWSKMGLTLTNIFPPYFHKLAAFFQYYRGAYLIDRINGLTAMVASEIQITFPEIPGSDVLDMSDATFWDNSFFPWYTSEAPRRYAIDFFKEYVWAEAATASTHARLFHREYSGTVKSILPLLIYSYDLSAAEQQVVVGWLNWYFAVTNDGAIVTDDSNIVITS